MNKSEHNSLSNSEAIIKLKELIDIVHKYTIILKKNILWLLLISSLCASLGFWYAYKTRPIYTAQMTFTVEDEKSGGLSGALGMASSLGFDLGSGGGNAFSGANLIELIKSRRIIEGALIDTFKYSTIPMSLADRFIQINGIDAKLPFFPYFYSNKLNSVSIRSRDSIMGILVSNLIYGGDLVVEQIDKKVSIIKIEIKSTDELFAKSLVESLSSCVSNFYITTKTAKARMNVEILQKQYDSVKIVINSSISNIASIVDNTFNLNSALQQKRSGEQLRRIDVQMGSAVLTQLAANLEIAKVTLRKETPLIQEIDKPVLPLSVKKVGKLRMLVMGGFLGFIVSALLIIGLNWVRVNKLF